MTDEKEIETAYAEHKRLCERYGCAVTPYRIFADEWRRTPKDESPDEPDAYGARDYSWAYESGDAGGKW